jgi:hypothetical protein
LQFSFKGDNVLTALQTMETVGGTRSTGISEELRGMVTEELSHVLVSESFRNSKQAEKLLRYLVSHSLDEDEEGLRERAIGEKVFGREPKYDSNSDSIVRVWANHLRKRLAQYYLAEGSNSGLRFAIRPGSYRVEFHSQVREMPAPVPLQTVAVEVKTREPVAPVRPWPWALAMAYTVTAVLALGCGWLTFQNSQLRSRLHEPKVQAPLNLLWSRMFGGKQATQIVLADSNLSLFQDLLGKPVTLQDYVRHSYLLMGPGNQKALSLLMMRRYTSLADVDVLQRTLLLQEAESGRLEVIFARDFSPDDLKTRNVILVGSRRANPWVEPFEAQMNFRFDYSGSGGMAAIVNTQPKAGERARYFNTGPVEEIKESYGLLAFQPNLAHTGNAVIIAGLGMEGTLAAGELATNSDLFKQVVSLLGSRGELPYFEVLLKAEMVGSSVHGFKIVAWRTS